MLAGHELGIKKKGYIVLAQKHYGKEYLEKGVDHIKMDSKTFIVF